jgi:hypothetical protein
MKRRSIEKGRIEGVMSRYLSIKIYFEYLLIFKGGKFIIGNEYLKW